MRILDKTGTVRMAHDGDGARPEIGRGALRNLLLSSLPPGVVRWDARVTGIDREQSGFRLSFADGSVATTEILIGADGAWSKVRPLVSEASPIYSGISFVELRYLDADVKHPTAAALVGKGMMMALSDERAIFGTANRTTSCASMPRSGPRPLVAAAYREMLHRHFLGWHADFPNARQQRRRCAAIIGCCRRHRWPRTSGVTLLSTAPDVAFRRRGKSGHDRWGRPGPSHHLASQRHRERFTAYEATMFPRAKGGGCLRCRSALAFEACPAGDARFLYGKK